MLTNKEEIYILIFGIGLAVMPMGLAGRNMAQW